MYKKFIIYDLEIFPKNSMLGAIILEDDKETLYQTWDEKEITKLYNDTVNDSLWIGHNNFGYDDLIVEEITKGRSAFNMSQQIVNSKWKPKCNLPLHSFDLMTIPTTPYSLKLTELLCGKNIHTTDVDFLLPRELNSEEKELTNLYNADDLKQTLYNFKKMKPKIDLRLDMIQEFNLNPIAALKATPAKLAAMVLGAKKNEALKYAQVRPQKLETLRVNNEAALAYYYQELYKTDMDIYIDTCGIRVTMNKAGLHYAIPKYATEKLLYIDVSGYYNLIMILYNLLPRTIPAEGKKLYEYMYHEQLKLKKTNPTKRASYKTVLLAPFGAMQNEYTDFYDPYQGVLVGITGQMFFIDLLEKLDGKVKIVNLNTDGIMLEPLVPEEEVIKIIEEWENRTGFNCKKEHLYRMFQRDVNCYVCLDENNKVITKGDAVKNYDIGDEAYANCEIFNCKEPPIIAQGIVNYLLFDKSPEEFVEENKSKLILFQYACRKTGYDYMTYDTMNVRYMEHSTERLQGVDRVFAFKSNEIIGTVVKHKDRYGKHSQMRYPNLPDNVFVFDEELNQQNYEKIKDKIDYAYYIERICEKIKDFIM